MRRRDRPVSWASAIASGLVTFIMLVLLAAAGALVVVPKIMGGMSLTVLTGSMEPGIQPGDIVVTRGIDVESARDLKIGDVIIFLPYPDDPTLVTHRIIAQTVSAKGTAFDTQGDNNNAPDSWNPVQDFQIRGKLLYTVPKIGYLREWLGQYSAWLIPAAAIGLIGYAVISFALSFRPDKDPEHPDASPADEPGGAWAEPVDQADQPNPEPTSQSSQSDSDAVAEPTGDDTTPDSASSVTPTKTSADVDVFMGGHQPVPPTAGGAVAARTPTETPSGQPPRRDPSSTGPRHAGLDHTPIRSAATDPMGENTPPVEVRPRRALLEEGTT